MNNTKKQRWRVGGVIVSLLLSTVSFVPSVSAVGGDGASSNITGLDTNNNGIFDRITFEIANPNAETWQLAGVSPYGFSVQFDGSDIDVSSVSITSSPTANPVTVRIDLNEGDTDFATGTAITDLELAYAQVSGDQTCTNCVNDSTDEELNGISLGDTGGTDTEMDGAAPVLEYIRYQDADADGRIDQILLGFTETIVSATVIASNDLIFTNVGDFTGMSFGTDNTDQVNGSSSQWTFDLATEATVIDTFDNSGNIAMSSQNNFSLEDAAGNTNTNLGALNVEVYDYAQPIIRSFTYLDQDNDSMIDAFLLTFSELVQPTSSLAANDLLLTNVGDFTDAAFGADNTDLITTATFSVTVPLGTEATVSDTFDDSGNLAISSQNNFGLRDLIGLNSTLGAQTQAEFLDGATPSGGGAYRQLLQQQQQAQEDAEDGTNQMTEPQQGNTGEQTEDTMNEEDQEDLSSKMSFGVDMNGNEVKLHSLIKLANHPGVYYVDEDGFRHAFVTLSVYQSWYGDDFSAVVEVSQETMASLQLGSPITYRPGTMIKIPSLNAVYLVVGNGEIRHIADQSIAIALFGGMWNKMIHDVPESLFVSYTDLQNPIESAADIDLEALLSADITINDELF